MSRTRQRHALLLESDLSAKLSRGVFVANEIAKLIDPFFLQTKKIKARSSHNNLNFSKLVYSAMTSFELEPRGNIWSVFRRGPGKVALPL